MRKETAVGSQWAPEFITCGSYVPPKKVSPQPITFRRDFCCSNVKKAVIRCTAVGIFDIYVNGRLADEQYFLPGFTSYTHTLQYAEIDITDKLCEKNSLTAVVGAGWACGRYTYSSHCQVTARRQSFSAEIILLHNDGTTETICTDSSWQASLGCSYRFADFYDGETYDASVDDEHVVRENASIERLRIHPEIVPMQGEKVLRHEEMHPVNHFITPSGKNVWDFGQNFAGVIHLSISNASNGQKITVRHAEILAHGEMCFNSLRTAKATAVYICHEGSQEYSPRLTYMGFRYAEIEGISPENVKVSAYAVYSDLKDAGEFSCSDEGINRIQQNILWGAKSNFVDIPTDCPQRDERQGWTGDTSVFSSTACFNFDMTKFFRKWLCDVRSEQGRLGGIPFTVPAQGSRTPVVPTACWGDSCLIVPWNVYMSTGDKEILRENYPAMKRYFNAVKHFAAAFSFGKKRYIWQLLFQFGDWCAPEGGVPDWLRRGKWIGTAFYSNDCRIMAETAKALGYENDSVKYLDLKQKVDDAYISIFTDGNGKLLNEFQTAYVLPIYFRMTDDETLHKMADNLERMIIENDYHLSTGFVGTPYLLFALCDMGKKETAFRLLQQDTAPSWLYEIKKGATTFWEGWRTVPPDNVEKGLGNEESESGESFNHYAVGSVGDFLYRRVAGIEALTPGYKSFRLAPIVGGGITSAKASHETPQGKITVEWNISDNNFAVDFTVPKGCSCCLMLPDGSSGIYNEGNYSASCEIGGK